MSPAVRTRRPQAEAAPATRVAIYTRKSVSDGLDMEFNSLDAQREAVEAYVLSQRGAGWTALPDRYDDGGFTGANTDRPAFQRLLADIEAGRVDVVAVYKIDRLSRSLLDFTQLLDMFRKHNVAFVSVTQSFDTSTPMGRMVVSLLATFAQFERETTAERVRDKVAAARRKGMWTGGRPILGYDIVEKKLVVNESEAGLARAIFALYREAGSLIRAVRELNLRGWKAKGWTTKAGVEIPARAWTKTSLHAFLTNPLLVGKVRAGSELAQGQHESIIEQTVFDETQALLSRRAVTPRGWRPPTRNGALLRGLLSCACGASMIHHSARRHGRIYRSYVCAKALKQGAKTCPGSRAPMGEMDAFVIDRVRAVGRDPSVLEATLAADRSARDTKRPELEAEVQGLAHERGRVETERRNIVTAIGGGAAGLVERLNELDADLAELDRRAQSVRCDIAALDVGVLEPEALASALSDLEPSWNTLSTEERSRVLGLLIEQVVFHAESGEVAITFRPGGPRLLHENTCPVLGTSPEDGQANHPLSGEPQ